MTVSRDAIPTPLILASYVFFGALTLSPLLWAAVPPLVDYPGYLARMSILAAPGSSQNYLVHWQLIPNLAMDLVVPPLGALIGVENAGRLFIALTMALPVAATALLHRVLHGRIGLWPLASLLFVYNKVFYYGFLNYLFGLGVALLCFALWIAVQNRIGAKLSEPVARLAGEGGARRDSAGRVRVDAPDGPRRNGAAGAPPLTRLAPARHPLPPSGRGFIAAFLLNLAPMGRNRPILARLVLFSGLASLIFVLHLFAFGVYGLLIGSYEAGRLWVGRPVSRAAFVRFLAVFLQFVPAAGLWLANASAGGVHYTAYGDVIDKLVATLAPMNFNVAGSWLAPLVAVLAGLAWWRGELKLAPQMRWPLVAVIAAAAAMPNWLYGSWAADLRLPVVLPFIVIAATAPRFPRRWLAALVVTAGICLLTVRIAAVTVVWRALDQRFTEYRAAIRDLPRGARLLVAQAPPPEGRRRLDDIPPWVAELDMLAFRHIGELAILDRDAFVPLFGLQLSPVRVAALDAGRYPQQGVPLRLNQLLAGAAGEALVDPEHPEAQTELPGAAPYWIDWPQKFDYLLMLDFGERQAILPELLEPWARGSFFTLYKVTPPPAG